MAGPEIVRIVAEILESVSTDHRGHEAEVFITLLLQLLGHALYSDQTVAPAFAASLNRRLIEMARDHGVAVPWQLAQLERTTKH